MARPSPSSTAPASTTGRAPKRSLARPQAKPLTPIVMKPMVIAADMLGARPAGVVGDRLQVDGEREHRAGGDAADQGARGDNDPSVSKLHRIGPRVRRPRIANNRPKDEGRAGMPTFNPWFPSPRRTHVIRCDSSAVPGAGGFA